VGDRPLGQAQEHGQAVAGGGGQRVAVGRRVRRAVQAVTGREQLELVEQGDAGAELDLLAGDVPSWWRAIRSTMSAGPSTWYRVRDPT
jgi:hypothetical protein